MSATWFILFVAALTAVAVVIDRRQQPKPAPYKAPERRLPPIFNGVERPRGQD